MNTPTNIRDAAIHCEVRKIAYRQTKEGYAVTLLLHPQEVPPALATAHLGARYQMVLVELDDDETPNQGSGESSPRREGSSEPFPRSAPSRSSPKSYAQQIAMYCDTPLFRSFCIKSLHMPCEETTAEFVRRFCAVDTRGKIIDGTDAAKTWIELRGQYEAWKRVPA